MFGKTKRRRKRTSLAHWIGLFAAFCTIVSSAAVFIQFVYPVLKENYQRKTLRYTVQNAARGRGVMILVSDFERLGTYQFNVSGRILETLKRELSRYPDVAVYLYPEPIPTENRAKAEAGAKQTGADLVFWGSYDDAGVRPAFAVTQTSPSETEEMPDSAVSLNRCVARDLGLEAGSADPRAWGDLGGVVEAFPSAGVELQEYVREKLPGQATYLALLSLGLRFFHADDSESAFNALDACIKKARSCSMEFGLAAAHYTRGRLLLEQGDPAAAGRDFATALEMDSSHGPARVYRAYMRYRKGETAAAEADCDTVLAMLDVGSPPSRRRTEEGTTSLLYRLAGLTKARSGNKAMAIRFLEKGTSPPFAWETQELAAAQAELAALYAVSHRQAEAEILCRRALSLDSSLTAPNYWLAQFALELHRDTVLSCQYFARYLVMEKDSAAAAAVAAKMQEIRCSPSTGESNAIP